MIHRKNTTLRSILYLLAITLALFAALALVQRQEALAGKLIRLHVVANSNTASDQAVKLQVRDAVLAAIAPLTDASATQEEAAAALQGDLASIQAAAEAALRQAGQATGSSWAKPSGATGGASSSRLSAPLLKVRTSAPSPPAPA